MKIVVKPVKCGDCSILYGEKDGLLIDCGSDNMGNGLKSSEFAHHAIIGDFRSRKISDIMISHFHKDHFNGVLEISEEYKFKTAYLPYSIINKEIVYSKAIGRLLAVASSKSWGFQLSKNIISLFKKLEKMKMRICFLKKGDHVPFDEDKIRILWPETVETDFDYGNLRVKKVFGVASRKNDSHTKLLNETSDIFSDEWPTASLEDIEAELDRQFAMIIKGENTELVSTMEQFVSGFDAYLRNLHRIDNDGFEEDYIGFSMVEAAYKILSEYRERFRQRASYEELEFIKYFARQQYHSLVTSMNAISIVCDCKDKFLFLGDVPVEIIDHISPDFKEQYKLVKIQHHGTERYYTEKTLIGRYNVISNGGYERRKISEGIVENVGENKIVCTSAHNSPERFCGYYKNNGKCGPKCIRVGNEYLIDV